uniref:Uncharacterized protein n=1 Tax=Glossina palpalis gambiensis TaxID=67801 RepID=A0A1B0C621_9MUSC
MLQYKLYCQRNLASDKFLILFKLEFIFDVFGNEFPEISEYRLDNIIDIISYHSPNQSILIGWSLGGLIATKAIIQNPEKFHGLIENIRYFYIETIFYNNIDG